MPRTGPGALLIAALLIPSSGPGQSLAQRQGPGAADASRRNVISAVPVTAAPPVVDGRLDDEAWRAAPALTDFLQRNPDEGAAASESTAVRFVFTDRALYVGFRGYDRNPERVYGRLTRRDQRAAADQFSISLDSYYDRRSAFEISINPAGARRDVFIFDDGRGEDDSWDPVYDWATRVDSLGWTVELEIPFSQLRFTPRDSIVFGVRLTRRINRRNEEVNWPFFARDVSGEVSQYGDLVGIVGLPAPKRVELLPYTAGSASFEPEVEGDPFATGRRSTARAGLDAKVGITSGITLDLTVNPDFGQVEADAAEVNLSAFESFFEEKRPFFVEGTNLFRFGLTPATRSRFGFSFGGQEGLVYTRRIGRAPQISPSTDGGYGESIAQSTIGAAAKVTGQISGWAFGVMQAVTTREQAQTVDSLGIEGVSPVEPLTSYTVARAQRNAAQGRVAYGVIGTATARRMDDPAFEILHDRAFSGGADLNWRFAGDAYELGASVMGSHVAGTEEAILRTQRRSARYYQRPDQDYMTLDSARTSLSGAAANLRIAKVMGFLTWDARYATRSPGFEVNDLGFMRQADQHEVQGQVNLRWLRPGRVFRRFEWRTEANADYTWGGERTRASLETRADGDFLNYWNLNLSLQRELAGTSVQFLRGGPSFDEPGGWRASLRARTDFSRPYMVSWGANYRREDLSGARDLSTDAWINLRPPGRVSFNLRGRAGWDTTDRQYLTARTVGDSTVYLVGRLDQNEVSLTFRTDLALTPRLSLEFYAEPFISAGRYGALRLIADPHAPAYADRFDPLGDDRLTRPGGGEPLEIDVDRDGVSDITLSEPDFRVVSFRSNAVLRWEFRPGSTLFVVWQQDRSDRIRDGTFDAGDAFGAAFGAPGAQVFAVKIAYWLGR